MIKIIVIAGGIVAGSLVALARELCKFSEEINPYRNIDKGGSDNE